MLEKSTQGKLLLYLLLSAISFTYCFTPENAGLGILVFTLLQGVMLFFIIPKKQALWIFIPMLILAANSFVSGNTMWRVSNVFVVILLYAAMYLFITGGISTKGTTSFISKLLEASITPLKYFTTPFQWYGELENKSTKITARILKGIFIAVPCLLLLCAMLAVADQVFSVYLSRFSNGILSILNFNAVFKILLGVLAGFYLFGMAYMPYDYRNQPAPSDVPQEKRGDLLVLSVVLGAVLITYTCFVVIQFQYLFAGSTLPDGLTYTTYARKGFFELLFLSFLNIALILLSMHLTKQHKGRSVAVIKGLCIYLCAITIILLASSFFRMWLYSTDDGLTRLRLLVFGFLLFETVGLLFTMFYIIKPKFQIILTYTCLALTYYLLLNLVPIDRLVAKNQVDRYFMGQKAGIVYVTTLSPDATPEVLRLLQPDNTDLATKLQAKYYFENLKQYYTAFKPRWQRYNLSVNHALDIYASLE